MHIPEFCGSLVPRKAHNASYPHLTTWRQEQQVLKRPKNANQTRGKACHRKRPRLCWLPAGPDVSASIVLAYPPPRRDAPFVPTSCEPLVLESPHLGGGYSSAPMVARQGKLSLLLSTYIFRPMIPNDRIDERFFRKGSSCTVLLLCTYRLDTEFSCRAKARPRARPLADTFACGLHMICRVVLWQRSPM